jgi:DNA-binding response OmpR family regulator
VPAPETPDRPVALVIEDDPDVSDLLETVLTQAGFTVHTAASGQEGIDLARQHQPALATIDVQMPHMDGLEATRRIREFSSAYIVIISTRSRETDVLAGFDAGADDYVPKPIRPRELRARLAAVARRPPTELLRPGSDAPAAPAEAVEAAAPGWAPAAEDAERAELLRQISAGEPVDFPVEHLAPDTADPEAADDGRDGREGMLEVGMRFVGGWVDFRGLRMNPARSIVVVDDRLVELPAPQVELLEMLMYAGTRVVTSRQIGLRLRKQTEETSTSTRLQDERMIAGMMAGLRTLLGESLEAPRWFEELPGTRFRLVRPGGGPDDAARESDTAPDAPA